MGAGLGEGRGGRCCMSRKRPRHGAACREKCAHCRQRSGQKREPRVRHGRCGSIRSHTSAQLACCCHWRCEGGAQPHQRSDESSTHGQAAVIAVVSVATQARCPHRAAACDVQRQPPAPPPCPLHNKATTHFHSASTLAHPPMTRWRLVSQQERNHPTRQRHRLHWHVKGGAARRGAARRPAPLQLRLPAPWPDCWKPARRTARTQGSVAWTRRSHPSPSAALAAQCTTGR
jgi:hypothetical protein